MKRLFAAAMMALLPLSAWGDSQGQLSFTLGLGGQVGPDYLGSRDYSVAGTGTFRFHGLRLGQLELGNPDPNFVRTGLHPRVSFRIQGARRAADNPLLAGLSDVDTSVELGGGLGYRTGPFLAFADLRYAVSGHNAVVGELGADLIFRPTERLTITAGPRAFWGADGYVQSYFGVTPAEAARSAFPVYAASGGFVSAGVALGARYALDSHWGIEGALRYDRLVGAAGNSPVIQTRDGFGVSLMLTRWFNVGG